MKVQTPELTAQRIATAPAQYRSLLKGGSASDEARFAVVRGARTVREAEAYLPVGYVLLESFEEELPGHDRKGLVVIIGGYDNAGWTLDGYVIPRLASGLMACEEIR